MDAPVYYDSHTHTVLCRHARGEPSQYVRTAFERGLKGIVFTCHNPFPGEYDLRMREDEFDTYLKWVQDLRQEWTGKLDVLLGLECDFVPGFERYIDGLLSRCSFDYVLGSVHDLPAGLMRSGSELELGRAYYEMLAQAADSGIFSCLAHPDFPKTELSSRWKPDVFLSHLQRSFDRIAKSGVAVEVNTSGLRKHVGELYPGPLILKEFVGRGLRIVIGSDAHAPEQVGAGFEQALGQLEALQVREVSYFRGRKRVDVPINAVMDSLKAG